jgi:RNA polymerase sigma-70 factor (ECF subfamily)
VTHEEDVNEAQIWARALERDGHAFTELFVRHKDRVYRRALAQVGDVHSAEDVTAAAFFELWRKRASVRVVDGSVLPWLLVTAVNLSRNHTRGVVRYRRLIETLPRSEPSVDPAEVVADAVDRTTASARISDAVSGLGPRDAALLVLTTLEGLSIAEAAAALGLKPGTARMRLHRSRQRLRLDLEDLHPALSTLPTGGIS